LENCAKYCLDPEPEYEPEPEPEQKLSKVGTGIGTAKNHYGSTTLIHWTRTVLQDTNLVAKVRETGSFISMVTASSSSNIKAIGDNIPHNSSNYMATYTVPYILYMRY